MKYIEKLLKGAEVKWMPLGEVAEIKRGKSLQKSDIGLGDIPIILYGELYTTYGNYIEEVVSHTSLERANNATLAVKSNLLLPLSSTTKEAQIGKASVLCTNKPVYIGGDALILSHSQDAGYLVHLLNSGWFEKRKMRCVKGTTIMHLSPKELLEISIPVPPLAVQEEIARILDKFTTLEAELEAELDCRKRQYEYYRNQLLSLDVITSKGNLNNVEVMTLGEIGTFVRGSGLQKKDFTPAGVGCIHYGQIYTYYGTCADKTKSFVSYEFAQKARKAKTGDLIIATTSENDDDVCKAVVWLGDDEIAVSSDACYFTHKMNPKYVAYYFQTDSFQKQKRSFITGTKVRRVNATDLTKIKIPIPPLAEQQRIVSILDKFEALTTSISEGLPKEIALRRKQYEYYRNQLLLFA